MFKQLIVDAAYFLTASKIYQRVKHFFYNLLENDNYRYKKYFDSLMIILIVISIIILIREVKSHVNDFFLYFNTYIISIIFLIEYLLRLWVISSISQTIIQQSEHDSMLNKKFNLSLAIHTIVKVKLKYILSVRALIDLLAIIPFFHQLRLLRIFIIFRVFKLFRYARSFKTFTSVLLTKKFEFITLLLFSSIVIFVSSILIYIMEANYLNTKIETIYDAFYWSIVTMSTVGYGDITPVTNEGKLVATLVIIAGITVFAFTTSIIVSAFTEKLDEIKERKNVDNLMNLKEFYIVCGYEDIAQEVVAQLFKNNRLIVLDEDILRVEKAQKDGFTAFNYDPGVVESYKKLHIDMNRQVKAILCLRENDVENVYTALTVRSFNKEIFILSLLINEVNRKKLIFAGINEILYSKELVGLIAKEFVGKPVAFEVIHALRSQYSYINIEEILLTSRIVTTFFRVEDLKSIEYRLVLLGIYKKKDRKFFFNPSDSTLLEEGDYLVLIGNNTFIREYEKYLKIKKKR
ncbi:MAG: ion transporter [Campylobacterota bacterium]|nr:ion transporter [Campylobacterota bacterium]